MDVAPCTRNASEKEYSHAACLCGAVYGFAGVYVAPIIALVDWEEPADLPSVANAGLYRHSYDRRDITGLRLIRYQSGILITAWCYIWLLSWRFLLLPTPTVVTWLGRSAARVRTSVWRFVGLFFHAVSQKPMQL